jgi:hypothetical protein
MPSKEGIARLSVGAAKVRGGRKYKRCSVLFTKTCGEDGDEGDERGDVEGGDDVHRLLGHHGEGAQVGDGRQGHSRRLQYTVCLLTVTKSPLRFF